MPEHLRDAVRTARMERGRLRLRYLAHLAEHLARRRLVEPDRVVLRPADDTDRLPHAKHSEPADLRGKLRLLDRERNARDRAEVVDLVRLCGFNSGYERWQVTE